MGKEHIKGRVKPTIKDANNVQQKHLTSCYLKTGTQDTHTHTQKKWTSMVFIIPSAQREVELSDENMAGNLVASARSMLTSLLVLT